MVALLPLFLFGENIGITPLDKIIAQKQKYYDDLKNTTKYKYSLKSKKINELEGYIFSKEKQKDLKERKTPNELIASLKIVEGLETEVLPIIENNKILKRDKDAEILQKYKISNKPTKLEKALYNLKAKEK